MANVKTINLLLLSLFIVGFTTITSAVISHSEETKQQIIIKDNIKSYSDFGEYTDPAYREFYNPSNLFDNLVNTWSFWSQYGKAGFVVDLKNPVPPSICSVQIGVFNPQNVPFQLKMSSANKTLTESGILDTTLEQINFDNNKCIQNLKQISMAFNGTDKWTTLSEIKLFTNVQVPPVEPPVCPPNSYWDDTLKKCVEILPPPIDNQTTYVNATITLNVANSTVIVNADETSKVIFTDSSVQTQPQQETPQVTITTPKVIEDEDEDEDDKKKKKDKKGDDDKN